MTREAVDQARLLSYRRLLDGEHGTGPRGRVVLVVRELDLEEDLGQGSGQAFVAAGLGLALVEAGYGVRVCAPGVLRRAAGAHLVLALDPETDPSDAPAGAWSIAWVLFEPESWRRRSTLAGFDQVVAGSELALGQIRRVAPPAAGVLRSGVDTELFVPATPSRRRERSLPRRQFRVLEEMGGGEPISEVLRTAARGLLPVVRNGPVLAELGLVDVATYTGSTELAELLTVLEQDPAGTARRAERLQQVVGAEHSWQARAKQLEALLPSVRPAAARPRPVHFFPDYSHHNPYQTMLHGQLAEVAAYPVPVENVRRHLRRRARTPGDPGVLCLHWTAPILQWAIGPFRARLVLDRFTAEVDAFRARGGRLVWTIHNALPHDARHRWAEIELAKMLADRADLIHVMSEATVEAVHELYPLDPAKVVVIEHASYLGVYPDWISREAARERLGLRPEEKALVALGSIRPYKGLDALLDAFEELLPTDPTLRLLVAGQAARDPETASLRTRLESHPRVVGVFDPVPPDQLQVWMRAADLAVLPYRQVLNSGAFLLAQTFGLPVVAPRAGSLQEEEAEPHVYLFAPEIPGALSTAVQLALDDIVVGAEKLRAHALGQAQAKPPAVMAQRYAAAIEPLL